MKNLLLDHCRRWWWVFTLGGAYATILGWSLATPDFANEFWQGKHSFLEQFFKIQSSMLLMQSSCLAVFTGAMLLLYDLQRGLVRAVAVLPLTGRQLGRSWWLATVAAPAVWQIALLSLGAEAFYLFHPGTTFPVARLLLADLLIFLWFGTAFVIYFVNQATQGIRWQKLCNFLATVTIIWMMFGFALSLHAQKSSAKWGLFLGLGLMMTIFGWWRAGQFIPGQTKPAIRARARAHSLLTPLSLKYSAEAVAGSGGIPLLASVTSYRAFWFCLYAAVAMPLAFAWQGQIKSWPAAIEFVAGFVAAYWVLCFFTFTPALRQLRYLRTLPLSASRLALVLIVLALLPLLALGALTAGIAWLSTDTPTTLLVLKNFLFVLAPASLCLAVAVWRGTGVQNYAVLILMLIGFQVMNFRNLSLGLVGVISAICILVAFLFARLALRRSRHAYLPPATPFGHFTWTGGK
jgi:hypothetical protein